MTSPLKTIFLGTTKNSKPLYISPKERETHLHIVGGSGRGKSKFMEHLIREDILKGNGLCLIDPHGSIYNPLVKWCEAKKILKTRKVILFDPTEDDWTFAFNPLRLSTAEISYHVDWMVKACTKVWGGQNTDQTPLLERCLAALFWVLAEQGLSLLEARYLIDPTDRTIREYLTNQIKDPDIKQEWDYFNLLKPTPFYEAFGSTINRMNRFLRFPTVKNILGQIENSINFREIMDEGAILLVNLAATKGKLSPEASRLLGTLIVNDLLQRALERPEKGARPFYLYIDECARYLTDDLVQILDECRKFGLHLILGHQRLEQLRAASDNIYNAVMSIQNKAIFGGIFAEDAEILARDVFLGELNLEEPKKILYKPVVVGHERITLQSHSRGTSESHGSSRGESHGTSNTESSAAGVAARQSQQFLGDDIITTTEATTSGQGTSYLVSEGEFDSLTESESWGWVEALAPVLKWLPTQVYNLEEQIYKAMAAMAKQPTQHAIIKLGNKKTQFVLTPSVQDTISKEEWTRQFKRTCYQLANFANPKALIEARIVERQRLLVEKTNVTPEEPESFRE